MKHPRVSVVMAAVVQLHPSEPIYSLAVWLNDILNSKEQLLANIVILDKTMSEGGTHLGSQAKLVLTAAHLA